MRDFEECLKEVQAENKANEYRERTHLKRKARAWKRLSYILAVLATGYCALFLMSTVAAVENPVENVEKPAQVVSVTQERPEEESEDFENEKIESTLLEKAERLDNVKVTHYCLCKRCCGKSPDHPAYGITASGRKATPGVSVAVDPSIIPLGSDVLVDYGDGEIHYYKADDTGSGVKGNHIDLCMGSHEEAIQAGVKTATVYVVKEG